MLRKVVFAHSLSRLLSIGHALLSGSLRRVIVAAKTRRSCSSWLRSRLPSVRSARGRFASEPSQPRLFVFGAICARFLP